MSISTIDKPEDKREKLKSLRMHHQSLLDALDVSNAVFIPKMAYRPYGKTEVHISFFLNEINKGEDVYVEFTSRDLVPEDPERKLYKWRFNPHFQEEYEITEPNPQTGHVRYLVPVSELQIVTMPENIAEELVETKQFVIEDPNNDSPIEQLTIRDLAAILLKKPVSHKVWLNELITK